MRREVHFLEALNVHQPHEHDLNMQLLTFVRTSQAGKVAFTIVAVLHCCKYRILFLASPAAGASGSAALRSSITDFRFSRSTPSKTFCLCSTAYQSSQGCFSLADPCPVWDLPSASRTGGLAADADLGVLGVLGALGATTSLFLGRPRPRFAGVSVADPSFGSPSFTSPPAADSAGFSPATAESKYPLARRLQERSSSAVRVPACPQGSNHPRSFVGCLWAEKVIPCPRRWGCFYAACRLCGEFLMLARASPP